MMLQACVSIPNHAQLMEIFKLACINPPTTVFLSALSRWLSGSILVLYLVLIACPCASNACMNTGIGSRVICLLVLTMIRRNMDL